MTTMQAKKAPMAEVRLAIGDDNGNGVCDVALHVSLGGFSLPAAVVDVGWLDARKLAQNVIDLFASSTAKPKG